MPTDWTYHADGVNTAVSTEHDLDGTLERVTLELDTFRVRHWTEEEVEAGKVNESALSYDEVSGEYEQFSDGAHATLRFDVSDGSARLTSVEPEDGDRVKPRHMPLLRASERVVRKIDGVDGGVHTIGKFTETYEHAEGIHIDALDA